jgi:hypothetical protein
MKCIKSIRETKNTELGHITRIDDVEAELKVKSGYWAYAPKSEWKLQTRKPKPKEEELEQKKKPNPKQMDGQPSNEPFVKTRKKSK